MIESTFALWTQTTATRKIPVLFLFIKCSTWSFGVSKRCLNIAKRTNIFDTRNWAKNENDPINNTGGAARCQLCLLAFRFTGCVGSMHYVYSRFHPSYTLVLSSISLVWGRICLICRPSILLLSLKEINRLLDTRAELVDRFLSRGPGDVLFTQMLYPTGTAYPAARRGRKKLEWGLLTVATSQYKQHASRDI